MKSNVHLIKVVMDGIHDTGMMLDYSEEAREEENEALCRWFAQKAMERMRMTEQEWEDAKSVLKLDQEQDGMGMCLKEIVEGDMAALKARM